MSKQHYLTMKTHRTVVKHKFVPGRRKLGYNPDFRIVCCLCGWVPPSPSTGSERPRALICHLEEHIEQLIKK